MARIDAELTSAAPAGAGDVDPRREAAASRRGRLTVFFGAAPGVGKTLAMLEAAQQRRRAGEDVVVAFLDPHGSADLAAAAQGLERVPPLGDLGPIDLGAVERRRPALVLVDDLGRANPSGAGHAWRWQEAQALLDAGIDVAGTADVGDVESLHALVEEIAGTPFDASVPDWVIDSADEVRLVDAAPATVLARVADGRVRTTGVRGRAAETVYRLPALMALRALAAWRVARRTAAAEAVGSWHVGGDRSRAEAPTDRILVAVGSGPRSVDVVLAASRLAARLRAPWLAVSVEPEGAGARPAPERARLDAHLALAASLGAETLIARGAHVGDELLAVARARHVTQIVIGKPAARGFLGSWRPNLVDWLVREAGPIGVHVTSGESTDVPRVSERATQPPSGARGLLWAFLTVVGATAVSWAMRPWFGVTEQAMVYLLGVLATAVRLSRRDAALTALASVVALDFFFVPPYLGFVPTHPQDAVTVVAFLATSLIVSEYAGRVRREAQAARERERRTTAFYAFSRALSAEADPERIAAVAARQVHDLVTAETVLFRRDAGGVVVAVAGADTSLARSPAERETAAWVLDHGLAAGPGTDQPRGSDALHVPIAASGRVHGVLAVGRTPDGGPLSASQRRMLDTLTALTAVALERAALAEQTQVARLDVERERTRNTLLSAVSHDLRTPLASITGAAGALLASGEGLPPVGRQELLTAIRDEGERLGRLVADLLQLTRLESGAFRVTKEPYAVDELVTSAVERVRPRLGGRRIALDVPPEVLWIRADGVLLEQVLVNLLENAAKYTPDDSEIEVCAREAPGEVVLEVRDRGPGIPPGEEEIVFDRFRASAARTRSESTGLGLALCHAIVRAHGGHVGVANRDGGGAVFRVALPSEPEPVLGAEDAERPAEAR